MRIVVAGATGTLGRHVVDAVREAGCEPVPLSRSTGTDLVTESGLVEALDGTSAVIDASATSSTSTAASIDFFTTVTDNLLRAERTAGVPHHVAISIIGAARVRANYYAGKAAQEDLLRQREGGWSLLRTTQFHDFAEQLIGHGAVGPLQVVPTMRSQPIATDVVADELVAIATGEPQGIVPDLAGPQEENMADLVRQLLAASGRSRPVLQIPLPGAWGRGMRDGSLLPAPTARRSGPTFAQWLALRQS